MKSIAAFLAAIFLLACLVLPVSSLEWKVLTISEKNLSIDMGPSFEIISNEFDASDDGMVLHSFTINNSAEAGSSAFISIMSIYDKVLNKMSPGALSELFLIVLMDAFEEDGATNIGQWNASDRWDRNVTVYTMSPVDEDVQMFNGTYDISFWNLDKTTYALMVSSFDKDNTTQIIKTLVVS